MNYFIDMLNQTLWLLSNVLVGYITIAVVVFSVMYPILFDPNATTAGKIVLRFVGSLVGVMGLIFIGTFIDPAPGRSFFEFPGDVLWWRPAVRFVGYLYVAYSVTALVRVLWLRKFRPNTILTAPDENTLPVVVRHRKP